MLSLLSAFGVCWSLCGGCVLGTAWAWSAAYGARTSWHGPCSGHVWKSRRTAGAATLLSTVSLSTLYCIQYASWQHLKEASSYSKKTKNAFSWLESAVIANLAKSKFFGRAIQQSVFSVKYWLTQKRKGKEEYLYSAFIQRLVSRHSNMDHTCKLHHACLTFVSVHQIAPPLNVVGTSNCSSLLIYWPR